MKNPYFNVFHGLLKGMGGRAKLRPRLSTTCLLTAVIVAGMISAPVVPGALGPGAALAEGETGYTMTITVEGEGTFVRSPDLEFYEPGTLVDLTAYPADGWVFSRWSGDLPCFNQVTNIIIDSNKNIILTFVRSSSEYGLSVTYTGNGTVTRDPPQATYTPDTQVQLTAVPDSGWVFTGWGGDLSGTANPATIIMSSDKMITAAFAVPSVQNLTVGEAHALIETNAGNPDFRILDVRRPEEYASGFIQGSFNIDFYAEDFQAQLQLLDKSKTYLVYCKSGVRSSQTRDIMSAMGFLKIFHMDGGINAWTDAGFDLYTSLDVNVTGLGDVNLNPAGGAYVKGSTVTLTAVPASGWTFTGWGGDLSGTANPGSITMDACRTVAANFTEAPATFHLSVNSSEGGSVTLNPSGGSYSPGTSVQLIAAPESGWTFSGWGGDLSGNVNPVSLTLERDMSVSAFFTKEPVSDTTAWWNTAWSRRARLSIAGNGLEDLSDFQVRIAVPYDADMLPDFSDIRFIDAAGPDVLPCWRESCVTGTDAVFWVKVHSIPASGTATLHMYYGNPSAPATSDIHSTFIWGDDFSDPSWTEAHLQMFNLPVSGNGTASQDVTGDGCYRQSGDADTLPVAELYSGGTPMEFPADYIAELEVNPVVKAGNAILLPRYGSEEDSRYNALLDIKYDGTGFILTAGETWELLAQAPLWPLKINPGTWHDFSTVVTSDGAANHFSILVDDNPYLAATDASLFSNGLALTTYGGGDSFDVCYDNFRVRRYAAIEPVPTLEGEQQRTDQPSGGSSGGGSSAGLVSYGGGGGLYLKPTSSDEIFRSADSLVTVEVPAGTMFLTRAGTNANNVGFREVAEKAQPPAPEGKQIISRAYKLTPTGATFDKPAMLTFLFDPSELQEGLNPETLTIVYWDDDSGEWTPLESACDVQASRVSTGIKRLNMFAVIAGTRPASFSLHDFSLSRTTVTAGESFTVSVEADNTGDLAGACKLALAVNGSEDRTADVAIAGGEHKKLTFELALDEPGSYAIAINDLMETIMVEAAAPVVTKPVAPGPSPASFTIELLETPQKVSVNQTVTVSVEVVNDGETEGSYDIAMTMDGAPATSRSLVLAGGASKVVVFEIPVATEGEHILDVNGLKAAFVAGPSVTVSTAGLTPLGEDEPSGLSAIWMILGLIVVAGVGTVIAAVLVARRKREIRG